MDSFTPCAPARVRTLVLPIGRIKRSRFYSFLNLLAPYTEIRLGDVTPDSRPDRGVFSPLAFPDGYVLYDFTTSMPSDVQLSLAPFELFRAPLLLLGIVDFQEHDDVSDLVDVIDVTLDRLGEQYPHIVTRKVLVFNSDLDEGTGKRHDHAIFLPPLANMNTTTMRTAMCDVTSNLLAEMTTLSASIKALPSIASPSVSTTGTGNVPWNTTSTPQLSRTNSQSEDRPVSPNSSNLHRMSMPVLPSNSEFSSRSSTPNGRQTPPPPQTFDDFVGSSAMSETSPKAIPINSRDASRDRSSMSGFGPGSFDERKRNQGKCRVSIVIGCLYLLAGRWTDALRDLADAAAQARSFSDHIWHAKALESMMTCLVLLAWRGIPFKIPPICYPILERTSSKLAQITSASVLPTTEDRSAEVAASRKELAIAIPEMANMIISIYNRAANYTGEYLPQMAYSECIIRLSKIQIGIIIGNNTLDEAAMSYIVGKISSADLNRRNLPAGKARIMDFLMRALPGPLGTSGLSAADEASITAGVAAALSVLGLQRKKAMLMTEYIHLLIRALDEARRSGAADAGVHPSTNGLTQKAATVLRTSGVSEGIENFLNLLCQVYGIPEATWAQSVGSGLHSDGARNGLETVTQDPPDRVVGNFILKAYGNANVKSDVLRACIALCEALPDPQGVLQWTATLLRIAGPGTAPSADSNDVLVSLSREEQLALSDIIKQTTSDMSAKAYPDLHGEYWDEFLVRGVTLVRPSPSMTLHLHKKSDMLATQPQEIPEKGPFIHDPFLERPKTDEAQNLMVAGAEAEFVVSLQNPYDFDVHIERINFQANGRKFGCATDLILRPYRTQSIAVMAMIPDPGTYTLDKCIVKVRGCRERTFSFFADPWTPPYDPKIKNIGLLNVSRSAQDLNDPAPGEPTAPSAISRTEFPKPNTVHITVIPPQPILEVVSISLPQSSAMLLEGERITFKMKVKNVSKSTSADFTHVSFTDSTAVAVQYALGQKNLSSAELFELEYQMKHHPAIKMIGSKPSVISPGQSIEFELELLGKPGLMSVSILLDYASLADDHTDNQTIFYSRQISEHIAVTVNSSIQMNRFDILPVSPRAGSRDMDISSQDDTCLLLLDLRNAWPSPLMVTLESVNKSWVTIEKPGYCNNRELVQPGHTARMLLLAPKVYVKQPHARIRAANERQFVVSSNALSPEAERIARELFWYRQELVTSLKATWSSEDGSRNGIIDLRNSIRLVPRMIDALKLDDVDIRLEIQNATTSRSQVSANFGYRVDVDEFAILKTTIRNRSDMTIFPLLRLRPSLSHQPADAALDLYKRLAFGGQLQTVLKPLKPGEMSTTSISLYPLCPGEYEVAAIVDEVKKATSSASQDKTEDDSIPDPVISTIGRRTWMSSQPCTIIATE